MVLCCCIYDLTFIFKTGLLIWFVTSLFDLKAKKISPYSLLMDAFLSHKKPNPNWSFWYSLAISDPSSFLQPSFLAPPESLLPLLTPSDPSPTLFGLLRPLLTLFSLFWHSDLFWPIWLFLAPLEPLQPFRLSSTNCPWSLWPCQLLLALSYKLAQLRTGLLQSCRGLSSHLTPCPGLFGLLSNTVILFTVFGALHVINHGLKFLHWLKQAAGNFFPQKSNQIQTIEIGNSASLSAIINFMLTYSHIDIHIKIWFF